MKNKDATQSLAMPSTSQRNCLDFKIQLLSGNSVVLVQCPGYESELFLPQIVKGRITFQNIIPNRRCCDAANLSSTCPIIIQRGTKSNISITPLRKDHDILKIGNKNVLNTSTPQSKSAPYSSTSLRIRAGKENISALLTPGQVRSYPPELPSPGGSDKALSLPSIADAQRLTPEYHPTPPTFDNEPIFPGTTLLSTGCQLRAVVIRDSNESDFFKQKIPVRTYSRRKSQESTQTIGSKRKAGFSWSTIQKKKKISTKPPNPTMKLEVRHRKLIVDSKNSMGPHDPKKILNLPITKNKISKVQVTGKTRSQFQALQSTAYDLITKPHTKASSDLEGQFLLACLDKKATTLPNYAEIAKVMPLQIDREVKFLLAKQKRMEKQASKSLPVLKPKAWNPYSKSSK